MQKDKRLTSLNIFYILIWGGNFLYFFYVIINRLVYFHNSQALLFFTLSVDTFLYYSILYIALIILSFFIPGKHTVGLKNKLNINLATKYILLISIFIYMYSIAQLFVIPKVKNISVF